ncbi:MAG: HEPN domain-containing protein [bacterium]
MKENKVEALRWLKQAEYNLQVAENNLNAKLYSASCFMSEQSAQVALKAYLIFKTGRPVLWVHSVKKLAENCLQYHDKFKEIVECGKILDRYYIPTRYPDALAPPAVPYEIYTVKDAEEAVDFARKIIAKVMEELKGGTNARN